MRDASKRHTQHWLVVNQLTGQKHWFDSEEAAMIVAIAIEKSTFVRTAPAYSLGGQTEGKTDE